MKYRDNNYVRFRDNNRRELVRWMKNNIVFSSWEEAQHCSRVLFRTKGRWNQDIQQNIQWLTDKIRGKDENNDGTVRIRLKKEWTDYYGNCILESIDTVQEMYKQKSADAYMKLFSCSEEE